MSCSTFKLLSTAEKKGFGSELIGRSQATLIYRLYRKGQAGANPHSGPTATWQGLFLPTSLPAAVV